MQRSTSYWLWIGAFQVVYGLAVFALTRDYYLERDLPRDPPPQVMPGNAAAGGWPGVMNDIAIDRLTGTPATGNLATPEEIASQADLYFNNRQYEQAADLYRRLLDFGPATADTHNNLGLTLQYLGRSEEALRVLQDGVGLDPDHQRIWLTLGFVNAQLGNIEAARSALTRATQVGGNPAIIDSAQTMLQQLPAAD